MPIAAAVKPNMLTFFCGAAFALIAAGANAEPVDLELVIATDVSRSINDHEAALQRQGIAEAFRSAEVVRAIQSGALGKIGVVYIDWSTDYINRVVVDWYLISDAASATGFAEALLAAPPTWGQRTSISSALEAATLLLENNDLEGTRQTIDVSGDGPNNYGASLAPVREATLAKGITINGLPIIVEGAEFAGRGFTPDIDKYYSQCVIGGQGAFLIVAKGFDDFAAAIRRKLVLEISNLDPQFAPRQTARIIPVSAARRYAQALPSPAPTLPVIPAPKTRSENCDRWGGGFGGFGFGR